MSKKFNWDDYSEVSEDQVENKSIQESQGFSFSDYEELPEPTPEQQISKTESGLRGVAEGATLGFYDELVGALGTGGSLIGGIKAALSKGDVSQDEDVQAYLKRRDEARAAQQAAREENPVSFGAGQIGGGLATAFVPGLGIAKGASLAKLAGQGAIIGGSAAVGSTEADLARGEGSEVAIEAAKGAGAGAALSTLFPSFMSSKTFSSSKDPLKNVAQYVRAAGLGAGAGATISALGSEGDLTTEEGREELLSDIKSGALFGGTVGLAARGAYGLGKTLRNTKLGQNLAEARAEGLVGKNISSKEFEKEVTENLQDLARKKTAQISGAKIGAEEALEAGRQAVRSELGEALAKAEADKVFAAKELKALEDNTKKLLKQEFELKNAARLKGIENKEATITKLAAKMDDLLEGRQKEIGQAMDKVQESLQNSNITFNVRPIKESLRNQLANNGLINDQIDQIMSGNLGRILDQGDIDYKNLRQLKLEMNNMFNSDNFAIRGATKKTYGLLNELIGDTLDNAGLQKESEILRDLNRKWSTISEIEEKLIDRSVYFRNLPGRKTAPSLKNIRLLEEFAGGPKPQSKAEDLAEMLKQALPEEQASQFISETTDEATKLAQLRKMKPKARDIKEVLEELPQTRQLRERIEAPIDPRLRPTAENVEQQLQQRISKDEILKKADEIKKAITSIEATAGKVDPEIKPMTDKLLGLLEKSSKDYDIKNDTNFKELINNYAKIFGQKEADEFAQEAIKASKRYQLGRKFAESDGGAQPSDLGLKRLIFGSLNKLALRAANQEGLMRKGFKDLLEVAKNNEALNKLIRAADAIGATDLARKLSVMGSKDNVKRSAILYTIMQNPEYRRQLKDIDGYDFEEDM